MTSPGPAGSPAELHSPVLEAKPWRGHSSQVASQGSTAMEPKDEWTPPPGPPTLSSPCRVGRRKLGVQLRRSQPMASLPTQPSSPHAGSGLEPPCLV